MSGLVKSRMFDNLWWVHNDAGNKPRLYGLNHRGEVVIPPWQEGDYFTGEPEADKKPWPGVRVGVAVNIDWETIAVKDGRLYIGDVGNNGNARRDLGIYIVPEPNPRTTGRTRTFQYIPIAYPGQEHFPAEPQWRYDCEAMFFIDGRLHLLTKHRRGQKIDALTEGTTLYRLDTMRSDQINVLRRVDSHDRIAAPTGGAVSPEGRTLAVLTVDDLWLFQRPEDGDQWLSGESHRIELPRRCMKQAEAICWDDTDTLRIINEQRDVFTVTLPERNDR